MVLDIRNLSLMVKRILLLDDLELLTTQEVVIYTYLIQIT